ncbi:biotin synthase BioB, partial [Streptomyces sp. NPDC046182]
HAEAGGGCGPCGGHAPAAETAPETALEAGPESGTAADGVPGARTDLVAVRRRGAGTELAPNA